MLNLSTLAFELSVGDEIPIKPTTGGVYLLCQSLYRGITVVLISAFLLPASSLSQSISQPPNQQQAEFVTTLLNINNPEKEKIRSLLEGHKDLVTLSLWEKLITRAEIAYIASGIEKSLPIYNIAIEVAEFLKNKRCLAITHYKMGRAYAGAYQIKEAIKAYISSNTSDIF